MDPIVLQAAVFKLAFALAACVGAWAMLRALDKSLGVGFRSIHHELGKGNVAIALYYGLRFIGVAILIGLALG